MKPLMIRGAGGGGGKSGGGSGRAPVESPDNLRSIQFARVLDLVSEGEIGGLVDGLKSVFLNDTPIQNADGTYNFNSVVLDERTGTQSQTHIPGFDGSEAETAVGAEVKFSQSVTRTITNPNDNAVRVTISVPQLTFQNVSNGDLGGTSVEYAVDVQNNGGGFVAQALRKIYSTGVFAIGPISRNTVASTNFNITVTWAGQPIQAPQTLSCKLQYRIYGNSTWLDYASFVFQGGSSVNSGIGALGGLGIGGIGGIGGGIFGTQNQYPSGTKTFNVQLASNQYEFQIVKTSGSIQNASFLGLSQLPSLGTVYGGIVAITSAEAYVPAYTNIISGKTTSKYQIAHRIELPAVGPWDIRVRRITADSVQTVLQNKTFWDSYTEIIDASFRYPNSAVYGLQIDASQFNAIPTRGYEIYGVLVKVPSNYDPTTRVYTGVWDGTFTVAWTNNPAWLFYNLLTNTRYGLGEFITELQVDKWALYNIAQYCDQMVPDGFGGIEPRFTCAVYLQTREDAYKVLANFVSIFRGMNFWSDGQVSVVQDAPSDPVALFTTANVIGGQFNYSGSSGNVRHTVVLVNWIDPKDGYRQVPEYVQDEAAIARYGIIDTSVVAMGCFSRGQAHRVGKWLIYSEQNETETNTFKCGMDGTYVMPGMVIKTQDPTRAGVRFGGRLLTTGTSQVQLDAPITLSAGHSYVISVILPDGSIQDRAVTNAPSTTNTINVTPDFSQVPQVMAIWTMASDILVTETWRVISVAETDKAQLEITALNYRSDKYDAVEKNLLLEPLPLSIINTGQPDAPTALMVTESLYLAGLGVVGVKAAVSWSSSVSANSYTIIYQKTDQNPVTVENIATTTIDLQPIAEGDYTFTVYAVNALGKRSQKTSLDVTIFGKLLPPADVTGFSITKVSGVALAAWNLQPDLDVQVGGQIVIRHSPLLSGAAWTDGVILDAFSGTAVSGQLPLITGTYMAKAVDSSGNWSQNMTSFVATEGLVTGFNTVATTTQNPAFSGSRVNTASVGSAIQLDGITLIDAMLSNIDDWGLLDSLGGTQATGSYYFDAVMDLGTVLTRRFESDITALSFDNGDYIDNRTNNIDDWGLLDGDTINDCDVTLYASLTNDDPAGTPTWGPYTPFFVSDFTARAARFRLDLASGNISHNILVSALHIDAKVPV